MEEIQVKKQEIRESVGKRIAALSGEEFSEKLRTVENQLFSFANFLEAKIALLYIDRPGEVPTREILKRSYAYNQIVILPVFDTGKTRIQLMKVDNMETDLRMGKRGILEPDPTRCKTVPLDCIDIAIIPGTVFDEKGGRIGSGEGYYDRFIPKLPATTRKVSLAFEEQIVPQVPMESHDKYVDIIISNQRVIYKI